MAEEGSPHFPGKAGASCPLHCFSCLLLQQLGSASLAGTLDHVSGGLGGGRTWGAGVHPFQGTACHWNLDFGELCYSGYERLS